MKLAIKLLLTILIAGAAGTAGYGPAIRHWKERRRVNWDTAKVIRGDVVQYVNSTGTVRPVLSVSVGSFVSGPIVELNVDFNDIVKKDQILAKIDPQLFKANVEREQAALATRQADLERIEAQLQQSLNNYKRGQRLRGKNEGYVSDREMDALVFEVKSLQAQRKLAQASILQSMASLETSNANLRYTEIKSPVDGVVIDRKIDPGQTLAAQFQTPELFIVAPDLREKVHVFASVDEADMGLIQKADGEGRPVSFNVDSHPGELFVGVIEQIRVNGAAEQNVVTYPVVISASNPDLKLLPGMTASISFEVDSKKDVPKIPNEALRFYPDDVNLVRPSDRALLDSSRWSAAEETEEDIELSVNEKAGERRNQNKRHVWVVDGEFLKAVEIQTGLIDNLHAELIAGDVKEGDALVIGRKIK